jgi:hypothetical protein
VSYGTTNLDATRRRHVDLIIQNYDRLCQLNLPMAVRFDLGLTNWLPWAAEFFHPPEHYLYIVAGSLSEAECKRLRLCLNKRGIITSL